MFKLAIETDNDAFADDLEGEIGRILRETTDSVRRNFPETSGNLKDINGNTVGRWELN